MKFLATIKTIGVMFLYLSANVVGGTYPTIPIDNSILKRKLEAVSVVQRDATFAK